MSDTKTHKITIAVTELEYWAIRAMASERYSTPATLAGTAMRAGLRMQLRDDLDRGHYRGHYSGTPSEILGGPSRAEAKAVLARLADARRSSVELDSLRRYIVEHVSGPGVETASRRIAAIEEARRQFTAVEPSAYASEVA